MKPQSYIRIRHSVDSAQQMRYTHDEIVNEFLNDNVKIEKALIVRKSDGAVMGEILKTLKKLTPDALENEFFIWHMSYGSNGRNEDDLRFGQYLHINYDMEGLTNVFHKENAADVCKILYKDFTNEK